MFLKSVIRASALATVILMSSPRPVAAQTVPTPESVLGHKPGDDFYLASYDESREYFHRLVLWRQMSGPKDNFPEEAICVKIWALATIGSCSRPEFRQALLRLSARLHSFFSQFQGKPNRHPRYCTSTFAPQLPAGMQRRWAFFHPLSA